MEEIFQSLWEIVLTGLKVGWPLFVMALGLGGVAIFGAKDRIKNAGGWALVLVGFALLVWNLKR